MADLQKVAPFSPEEAHQWAVVVLGQIYSATLQPLVKKLGIQEVLQIARPALWGIGSGAPAMSEMMGITGKDAIAIASVIYPFEEQVLRIEGRVTEVNPDRVVREVTRCPWQDFIGPEFCEVLMYVNQGMVEAMNPEYKFTMPKMIPCGDPVCQWILEKK